MPPIQENLMSFDTQTHLSTIAVKNPRSIAVFRKYGLDFCCGGARPLVDVCQEMKLDTHKVLGEILSTLSLPLEANWETEPASKLIEHILVSFHQKHRNDLAILIPLARKVEAVHAENSKTPKGIHELLKTVADAMEEHMLKEENILFPWILNNGATPPYAPIQVMMSEHLSHKEKLIQLRATCHDFNFPHEACASWRALYTGVEQLIADLMEHIHLENNVLFPMALSEKSL